MVCCYPDHVRLLGAAADRARRQLVFSYPPRNAASRAVVGLQNQLLRLGRRDFRVFAHPPAAMLGTLADRGLHQFAAHRGPVWHVAATAR